MTAIRALEVISVALGLLYSLLAVRKIRWCWLAGGISAAILVFLALTARVPLQAVLNAYYVVMSLYGFWQWSRPTQKNTLSASTLPWRAHIAAIVVIVLVSAASAAYLSAQTQAAWPWLDSLATWISLWATLLVTRLKLENWLYWMVADSILVFVYLQQGMPIVASLYAGYFIICIAGYRTWRTR